MIKISVIVPVYNVENYLDKCLNSLVNQTLDNIEILVINDGSTDNSQIIIDKYAKKYSSKMKTYTKKNGGQGSARNVGLTKAKGKYISFVDSDDWLDENTLELMYKKLKQENSDIIICDMIDHFSDNSILYHNCTDFNFKYQKTASSCNKIFKKALIGDLKYNDKIWYEDLNFTTKLLAKTNKISTISKGFYHCHCRENSTMNNNNSIKNLDIIICLEDLKKYFKKEKVNNWKEIYTYLVYNDILIGAINRVSNHKKNANKEQALKQLTNYCRKNILNYKKANFYKTISINNRIIGFLNFNGLNKISRILLKIKKKVVEIKIDKSKHNSSGI